ELPVERLRERTGCRKLHRARGTHLAAHLIRDLGKYGTAVRQIAEVVLECGESSDDLSLEPVRGYPISHTRLRFGNNAVDRLPELLQGRPLGFVKFRQVLVNLLLRHELNAQITASPPR